MSEHSITAALMDLIDAGMLPGALVYAKPDSALALHASLNGKSISTTKHTTFYTVDINTSGAFLTVAVSKR